MRRQDWLQRNQAIHVVNAYGEALSKGKSKESKGGTRARVARPRSGGEKISSSAMWAMMGAPKKSKKG